MNRFSIKPITKYSANALTALNTLLLQWNAKQQLKPAYFKKMIKYSHILVMRDQQKMIGTVTIVPVHKLSGVKGSIEHLLIDEQYRGRGLGQKLMKAAIKKAKDLGIEVLSLTCEPERKAANALYKKLGFAKKDTNFYQLKP